MKLESIEHELVGEAFLLLRKQKAYTLRDGLQKYLDEGIEVLVQEAYRSEEFRYFMDWSVVTANGELFRIPIEELNYHFKGQEEVEAWKAVYDKICG